MMPVVYTMIFNANVEVQRQVKTVEDIRETTAGVMK
jgi:hypothetical protein